MAISRFNAAMKAAQSDIHKFCRILNFKPTNQQERLLQVVQDQTFCRQEHRKKGIACKSGQGPGKTKFAVVAGQWRTLQAMNEQTVVTAPTMRQVKDVFMTELSKTVAKADPDYQKCLRIDTTKATFFGMKDWKIATATSTRPENIQGYHSAGMTIIVDEASGILRPIWQTIKGTTTGPENLIIAIGNPNDRDTEFFDMFGKDIANYSTHTWSAEDSPNVSRKHILDMEREYGRESDVFRVRVLGEFPRENPNAVIRYEDLLWACEQSSFATCFRLQAPTDDEQGKPTRQFGIDLARFGGDEGVIVARYNSAVVGQRVFVKKDPAEVIRAAFAWQRDLGWSDKDTRYCCDAGGMGQGSMHLFYENNKEVFEFHSQGTPFETQTFHDAISEAYWTLRRLTRGHHIHLKKDSTTFNQLVSRQYRFTDGKIRLESKDEFLIRVGTEEYSSPDRADAVAMAFYPYAGGGMRSLPVSYDSDRDVR